LAGVDDLGESLTHAPAIDAFEARRRLAQPWLA
jgi:3-isopropylmalate/(R)-2-methylmalate dehydratase small subunit